MLMCAVTVAVMVVVVVSIDVVDQVAISHLEMFQNRLYVARLRERNEMHSTIMNGFHTEDRCDDIAIFFPLFFSSPLCSAAPATLCSTTNPQSTNFSVFHRLLLRIALFSSAVLTDVTS